MEPKEVLRRFKLLTRKVDWKELRKEQGIRVDMNLERNLLIRFLSRHKIKPVDTAPLVGLKYPQNRQQIYDIRGSKYPAYRRIEKELGLA
jgi:hypothetical protein